MYYQVAAQVVGDLVGDRPPASAAVNAKKRDSLPHNFLDTLQMLPQYLGLRDLPHTTSWVSGLTITGPQLKLLQGKIVTEELDGNKEESQEEKETLTVSETTPRITTNFIGLSREAPLGRLFYFADDAGQKLAVRLHLPVFQCNCTACFRVEFVSCGSWLPANDAATKICVRRRAPVAQ